MVIIIKCGSCGYTGPALEHSELSRYECMKCGVVNEITNIPLKEWLGFAYPEYLDNINSAIDEDKFKQLLGTTKKDIARGKLTQGQVTKLKSTLKKGFNEGSSIKQITKDIKTNVKVKDLTALNGALIPAVRRNLAIARTETTRMANLGSAKYYKSAGIKRYSWVATFGERTCEQCAMENGQTHKIGYGPMPPLHSLCRCTIIPEVSLK